ncbi:hypothetical protein L1887_33407 [Cichorium endivia]|nr:hypothetical protein L1887_33407 [Cichorium endivia]
MRVLNRKKLPLLCDRPYLVRNSAFRPHSYRIQPQRLHDSTPFHTFKSKNCYPSKAFLAVSCRMRELQNEHHMKSFGLQVAAAGYNRQLLIVSQVEAALFVTGRAPFTNGLDLENGKLVPHLYCIGDVMPTEK